MGDRDNGVPRARFMTNGARDKNVSGKTLRLFGKFTG